MLKGDVKPRVSKIKELMFVDMWVNGIPIRAMVDTGAIHNSLSSREVERLNLDVEKGQAVSRKPNTQPVQLEG